jgi:tetratricopeptide (TPR) repeat protein
MKSTRALLLIFATLASASYAAEDWDKVISEIGQRFNTGDDARAPQLDPKRIINDSNSFLKEREPEMTAEEYAIYERVISMQSTRPDFALKLLEAMMSDKEPPSPAFEFILGNVYYAAGQNEKSEASYRSAVNRYPTFLRGWSNLGLLYYTTNRFDQAATCFSKAIVLGDREPGTFGLLGYSLEKEGNLVSAEMAYMQALSGDPANRDWKEGLLRICIEGKQLVRAESLVKSLIKQHPEDTRFWLTYATILLSDNRRTEAIVVLEACSATGVAGTSELTLLGDLYAEQNLIEEAIGIYSKVLGPAPQLGEQKLLHFAQVLIAGGRLKQAESVLNSMKSAPTEPGRLKLLQTRADLFAAQKRWPAVRETIEALLKVSPLDGRALVSLGRAYAAEEDLDRALFAFEAAFRVPSTTYVASLELANIELKNRHYAKSVEYLEKALSIEKTDAVEDYLNRVKTLVVTDG